MGKKDITLKDYLSDAGRYADLLNGSIFQGRQIIHPEELQDTDTAQAKSDRQAVLERMNDIAMKQTLNGNLFAVWVVANQENIDYSMPIRVMLQDALAYDRQLKELKRKNKTNAMAKKQDKLQKTEPGIHGNGQTSAYPKTFPSPGEFLSGIRKTDRLRPVITLVVYWGEEKWQGAQSLHDIIDFGGSAALAEELKKLVPEYPLHFLNLSEVHDYSCYKTELKTVFELYDRRNDKAALRQYLQSHKECSRLDAETYWALSILLNEQKLKENRTETERGDINMCKAIEDLIADGVAEGKTAGRIEGRTEGNVEGRLEMLYELVQEGLLSVKDASMKASMTENIFSTSMLKAGY